MKEIINSQETIQGVKFYFRLFELHKSHIFFISDQEEAGIGTVTLAIPLLFKGMKASSNSNLLFGMKYKMLTQVISEKIATTLKTPVLLLLHLVSDHKEEELIKPLNKLINDLIHNLENNS